MTSSKQNTISQILLHRSFPHQAGRYTKNLIIVLSHKVVE